VERETDGLTPGRKVVLNVFASLLYLIYRLKFLLISIIFLHEGIKYGTKSK